MTSHVIRANNGVPIALCVTLVAILSATPTGAYPIVESAFEDGTSAYSVTFERGVLEHQGPALVVLSNTTAMSGSLLISGSPFTTTENLTETTTADFQSSSLEDRTVVAGGAVSLARRSSVLRLNSSNGFGGGVLTGLALAGMDLVLSGTNQGTLVTDNLSAPEGGWGTLLATATVSSETAVALSLLDPSGTTVVATQEAGAPIDLGALQYPTLRVRATLLSAAPPESPALREITLGQVAGETRFGNGVARNFTDVYEAPDRYLIAQDPTALVRYGAGPLLTPRAGTFYAGWIAHLDTLQVNGTWWGYFAGLPTSYCCSGWKIGRATSADLVNWSINATPMLAPTPGTWDRDAVNQPTVLPDPSGSGYLMYYSGSDGSTWRVGLATSPDGVNWTKYAGNPVLSPSPNGWDELWTLETAKVEVVDGLYTMWYIGHGQTASGQLGVATSTDGRNWTRFSGNPVMPIGGPLDDDREGVIDGTMERYNGAWLFYYTCRNLGSARLCFASSPNGYNWTKYGVVLQPRGGWEGGNVAAPDVAIDNGKIVVYYFGDGGPGIQMGRADGTWIQGTFGGTVDFGSRYPASLDRFAFNASIGGGTDFQFFIRSSIATGGWTAYENVTSLSTVATPAGRFLQWVVRMNSTLRGAPPWVSSLSISYSSFASQGRYESGDINASDPVTTASISGYLAPGPSGVSYELSEDGGATWVPALNATPLPLGGTATRLRYALTLQGQSFETPTVGSVSLTLRVRGFPAEVQVRLGASSTPFFSVTGSFNGSVNATLPVDVLNAAIAAAGPGLDPPVDVIVPLFVRSSNPGTVTLSELRLTVKHKNPLTVAFGPEGDSVRMDENATAPFSVAAQTFPAGVLINRSWFVDDILVSSASGQSSFLFAADFDAAGIHHVRCVAENGDFSFEKQWTVFVANVNRPPTILGQQPPSPTYVSHTATVDLRVQVEDPDGQSLAYQWTVDENPVLGTLPSRTIGGLSIGAHIVTVNASDGALSILKSWTVIIVDSAPTLDFYPDGEVSVSHADTAEFSVTAIDPEGDSISYAWTVDGAAASSQSPTMYLVHPPTGHHNVSVTISSLSHRSTHSWTVESGNLPPTIQSTNPDEDPSLVAGAVLRFSVAASDPEGDALTYAWSVDGVTLEGNHPELSYGAGPAGTHHIAVRVTDGDGEAANASWTVAVAPSAGVIAAPGAGLAIGLVAAAAGAAALLLVLRKRRGGPPRPE